MTKENVLLICGGDGSEHDISIISAQYIKETLLASTKYNVINVVLKNHEFICDNNQKVVFSGHNIIDENGTITYVDCVIPCLHGQPGESGDIQSFLEILNIPYIGCKKEASLNCFNKNTTKLYLDAYNIKNSPYIIIPKDTKEYRQKALDFYDSCNDVYVKAASQGSSIGCYHVTRRDDLIDSLVEAFMFSSSVVIEKTIHHRELEVAVYELDGEIKATTPGEVIIPENVFYTFDEKYSKTSSTVTTLEPNLPQKILDDIREIAKDTFNMLSLRHLSRVDFFLTDDNKLIVNEINTFPGMTSISLFPKLLQHNGDNMLSFLEYVIADAINENKRK